jgi:FAD/FMN-containing dehydrogenase/Fe-S oxidoreductase
MSDSSIQRVKKNTRCDVRDDALSRALFSTDASIYQITPAAVAFPRSAQEASEVMQAAVAEGVPIVPRGAGTGLAGGAVGRGIVIDLSRYNRQISAFNRDAHSVRVQAGVVLDQLNNFALPHGLCFGPDVSTSSRATLGGMIANNSSGARAPIYGTTSDHVHSVELVLANGDIVEVGAGMPGLADQAANIDARIQALAPIIRERFHEDIVKRWPGYGLDRYLRAGTPDLSKLLGGSEGTLGLVFSATLNLVPLPKKKGLCIIYFDDLVEAMEATVDLLDLGPAGVEHIDDVLVDQTKGQLQFQRARDIMQLDTHPAKSILMVEFYEDEMDKVAHVLAKNLGARTQVCETAEEMAHVWNLRKAGLSLLTGRPGAAKPTAGVEDACIPPKYLPAYVSGILEVLAPLGLEASFYGHAASGLLHLRPVVDLHTAEDLKKFRTVADAVSALTKQYRGSLAAEHGVGIARTEFMAEQIGDDLIALMRDIKHVFDPDGVMNPGKIFPNDDARIDTNLRQGPGHAIPVPFETRLAFAAKDKSFVGNLEQCNGCGGCRKDTPTMCPTFIATGEEIMSTRGRANTIRAVLEGRVNGGKHALLSPELDKALDFCLSCKACETECPSNVNLALLKSELLHARQREFGTPLAERLFSRVDVLGKLGTLTPGLANQSLQWKWLRGLMEKTLGIDKRRPLPPYAAQRFDTWFKKRTPRGDAHRGTVILWNDCFVNFHEPHIGQAAVEVLEALGYRVQLIEDHACCGRPAFSTGRLDVAADFGRTNIAKLSGSTAPIIFLEASCFSMFAEDYIELDLSGAREMASRSRLFERFVTEVLEHEPSALNFDDQPRVTAIHAHCHAKAITSTAVMPKLAKYIPNNEVTLLNSACCGMAGSFGARKGKYEVSLQVAEPLVEMLAAFPPDAHIVASGTSCRHQIEHLTDRHPLHMAELLASALVKE